MKKARNVFDKLFSLPPDKLADVLGKVVYESEVGRVTVLDALVGRVSWNYQAIGRKLLAVEPLPEGALASYERDKDKGNKEGSQIRQ